MTSVRIVLSIILLGLALPCFAKEKKHGHKKESIEQWERHTGNGRIIPDSDYHAGRDAVDIDGNKGDVVKPFRGGRVVGVDNVYTGDRRNDPYGKSVIIEDKKGKRYRYSHLDDVNVRPGQKVSSRTDIGTIGTTGQVTPLPGGDGSHLDFERMGKGGDIGTNYEVAKKKKKKHKKN